VAEQSGTIEDAGTPPNNPVAEAGPDESGHEASSSEEESH
jgi:hypothetical protein